MCDLYTLTLTRTLHVHILAANMGTFGCSIENQLLHKNLSFSVSTSVVINSSYTFNFV